VLVDVIGRVHDAVRIARRSMHIARQSIWTGLAFSGVAMVFAGFGALPPLVGAGIQEAIDVAVILNALRTARDPMKAGQHQTETARRGARPREQAVVVKRLEKPHVPTLRA